LFDLSNLNDYEFELLCKDIMQRKLSTTLYTFSRGVDGGIDICEANKYPQIMIQVKHYVKSKYSNLHKSLQGEIEKVKNKNPKRYYVCTSLSLTKNNKDDIVEMFNGYIDNISSVIDQVAIDDFLQLPENIDIVKKHYKLWLCAANILSLINNQNVFIDCDELMIDIEKYTRLFVNTESFHIAKEKLNNNNVIIITGAPGVGKSTISKMLVCFFAKEKKYIVRYATDNNISDIKKVLSKDQNKKEIILLDDFLGQHYLKMKESQPNELRTLISFIEKSPNKKLIMNSRITIFKEAIQSSITFRELMEKHEIDKYLIDLDKMSLQEKAEILYNHLYFNDISKEYFREIKANKNYLKIVQHKNYNPRIIEYIATKRNYSTVLAKAYVVYIFNKLDNPEDVWKDEFTNRLDAADRILINTLYSLTDNVVDIGILEIAFNKRIQKNNYLDTSINLFDKTVKRLNDSLLKIIEQNAKSKISVLNPSINDYVKAEISKNPNEQISIINSAKYIEQIMKMTQSEEARESVLLLIKTKKILEMPVLKNSAFYYYFKLVVDWNLWDYITNDSLLLSVEKAYTNLSNDCKEEYAQLYFKLLNQRFNNDGLKNIFMFVEKISFIIEPMQLEDVHKLFEILNDKYYDHDEDHDCEDYYKMFKIVIAEKIQESVLEEINDELNEIVSEYISNADSDQIYLYRKSESNYFENCVRDEIQDSIYEKIQAALISINSVLCIKCDDFDISEMQSECDVLGAINAELEEKLEPDEYEGHNSGKSDLLAVESMFER